MAPRKKARLTPEKIRELQVAAAVARESVQQMHGTRALKLIDLADNRVSAIRMLSIYARVHGLSNSDEEILTNRVLALLGQRARKGVGPMVYVEGEDIDASETRSIVSVVRDRLKGRVLHDLRRWVELHTGQTQAALIDVHVRHGLRFVAELRDTHTVQGALQVYREMVDVPANMVDALYIFTLERLATEELPRERASSTPMATTIASSTKPPKTPGARLRA